MADPSQLPATVDAVTSLQDTTATALGASGGVVTLLLGWFGYIVKRSYSFTIPRLSNDFKASLEKQGDLFLSALSEQRKDFREEMHEQRHSFKEELQRDRTELGVKIERLSTAVERMDTTLRGAK